MGAEIASWWAVSSAVGLICWPLVAQVFPRSAAKGYAYARALGLIVVAYLYWLGCSWGLWSNSASQAWLLLGCLALIGAAAGWVQRSSLAQSLRRDLWDVVLVELLFAVCLVSLAIYKAHDAAIWHTEQPMDFAFLNTCLRSPSFPPDDPWMAGMQVSYYYFGYVMVALLTHLAGVTAGVGYNLGLASAMSLAAIALYGLLRDLLQDDEMASVVSSRRWAVLGSLAILLLGTWEGVAELLQARGWGSAGFYQWLGIPGLGGSLSEPRWVQDGWWWWRASRIISDANFLGRSPEVITEFPVFSFLLGDLHPHLMALPTVVIVVGLGREFYFAGREGGDGRWLGSVVLAGPVIVGALGFLNSWDLPTMGFVLLAGLVLGFVQGKAKQWRVALAGIAVLGLSLLYYQPFYQTLHTQVRGLGIAYYAKTPLKQYLLHFVWLTPALILLWSGFRAAAATTDRRTRAFRWLVGGAILVTPWVLVALVGGWGRLLLGLGVWGLSGSLLLPALAVSLAWGCWALWYLVRTREQGGQLFVCLLVMVALIWTYGCEFFFIRDVFETRMNTVFKVYYQAWLLLGIAGSVSLGRLCRRAGWQRRVAMLCCGLLLAGAYWPVATAYSRMQQSASVVSLDGTRWLEVEGSDEYGVWQWLCENADPGAVMVEAVGADYQAGYNRLSSWSGVPAILGWPGHEIQWRGSDAQVEQRQVDVATIYTSASREIVIGLLERYGVTYLVYGPAEQLRYQVGPERSSFFDEIAEPVFRAGAWVLYRVNAIRTN